MSWIKRQYDDIKGNLKFAIISWLVMGGGITVVLHRLQASYSPNIAGWLALAAPTFSILAVAYLLWFTSLKADSATRKFATKRQELVPVSPPAPLYMPALPVLPRPVDLRGEIQELFFFRPGGFSLSHRVFVIMKIRIVNHGPDDATITHSSLEISIGTFSIVGDVSDIPDSWRINRTEVSLFSPKVQEFAIAPRLGSDPPNEIYKKGLPREGWLAFECTQFQDAEFPNAQFRIHLKDSLGGVHCIERGPTVYIKTGEIVLSTQAAKPPTQ